MNNRLARILFIGGCILIIVALVYGIMALISGSPLILFVGIFIGLCVLALAEILDNVSDMNQKLDKLIEKSNQEKDYYS